jgi:hypothetical protein|tara:strand:- start:2257 stop:2691 length:435 start_codon:yes stop_codon:yes gene_type:complete
MNKPLYEALYYDLQARITTLAGALDHRIEKSEGMTLTAVEETREIFMELVQLKATRHELETIYKKSYESPPESAMADQMKKAAADAHWDTLMTKVNRIEKHLDPDPPKPPTHEELLARSSSYRDSQGVSHTEALATVEEGLDEE